MKSNIKYSSFNLMNRIIFLFHIIYIIPAFADQTSWDKLKSIREQYQEVNSLHVKSFMQVETMIINSPQPIINTIDYEQWAMPNGLFRTEWKITDANNNIISDMEYSYDGKIFYSFDKLSEVMSYGEIEPNGFSVIENPLFAPLYFLKNRSENPLKLHDILNINKWQKSLANAEFSKSSNNKEDIVKLSSNIMNNSDLTSLIYFEPNDSKIKSIKTGNENQFLTISINQYQTINLKGKKTIWPKLLEISFDTKDHQTSSKLLSQIESLEINLSFSNKIFTMDPSAAKSVWDNDTKTFVK